VLQRLTIGVGFDNGRRETLLHRDKVGPLAMTSRINAIEITWANLKFARPVPTNEATMLRCGSQNENTILLATRI
jgi:hypothetical protein